MRVCLQLLRRGYVTLLTALKMSMTVREDVQCSCSAVGRPAWYMRCVLGYGVTQQCIIASCQAIKVFDVFVMPAVCKDSMMQSVTCVGTLWLLMPIQAQ